MTSALNVTLTAELLDLINTRMSSGQYQTPDDVVSDALQRFGGAEPDPGGNEDRFRALANGLPQMIWASDPDGNPIFCNSAFTEFMGSPAGLTKMDWPDLVHPDDRPASVELCQRSLQTGEPYEREHRFRRADGEYRWILARALPARDASGAITAWFGTNTDVSALITARDRLASARDELTRQLEHRTAELEARTLALAEAAAELAAEMRQRDELESTVLQAQKLEALGQLTSSVAHDFANILTAISGSFTLIRRRVNSPAVRMIVDQGEFAADRARKLIAQLLGFVRRDRLSPQVVALKGLLDGARDLIQHAAGPGVDCLIDVAASVHPVLTDPNQLEVALLNLAANARDAMDGKGTLRIVARNIDADQRPPSLPPGDYVSLEMHDTGRGMPPEVLARATENFFTTKPGGKGTGLGLAMVKQFAGRLGGCLLIESTPGTGTVVILVLPRAPLLEPLPQSGAITADDPNLHGHATILLCDDDDQLRPMAAAFLRDLGYTVLEAKNAQAAYTLAATQAQLDLLLTDVELPGASGISLAIRLRRDWPALPVQFITGTTLRPALSGQFVLAKPLTFSALSYAILERLGRTPPAGPEGDRLLRRLQSPALRDLYLAWQTARLDGKLLPRPGDIDPARYGMEEHAYTLLIAGVDPAAFRFLTVGAALNQRFGRPLSGEVIGLSDDEAEVMGDLEAAYRRCTRTLAPVYQSARFDFGDSAPLHLERLIMPLSDDGQTITHLLGVSYFNESPKSDQRTGAAQ